ncbi:hypothetical protein MASR2M78_27440 [Treponema sp.]
MFALSPASAQNGKVYSSITIHDGYTSDDGKTWIVSDVLYSSTFDEKIETLVLVLQDYEKYPQIFSRLRSTEIVAYDTKRAQIRQNYEVRAAGFSFPSECLLQLSVEAEAMPRTWKQSWVMVSSDGSVKDLQGYWLLESVDGLDGKNTTRVSYRNLGAVLKRFPLQVTIMRMLSENEYARTFSALAKECARRAESSVQISSGAALN